MKTSDLLFGLMASHNKGEYSIADIAHLIRPFNISDSCLRTNLSRLSSKGVLTSRHAGKTVYYRFGNKGLAISKNVARGFRSLEWSNWKKNWWGVLFSVPDIQKSERYRIRKKLAAYRFVSLYAGFWIRPFHELEKMDFHLHNFVKNQFCKMIRFRYFPKIEKEEVTKLWKLKELNQDFSKALNTLKKSNRVLNTFSPEEAMVEKMIIGGEIVNILFSDPLLPDCYLPKDWKGEELKNTFQNWIKTVEEISRPYWEKIFESQTDRR